MAKTLYLCPLCQKQSGYISEYGMQDSVICKCQGLNEVGRLVKGQYVPSVVPPVTTSIPLKKVSFDDLKGMPSILGTPTLPQGQANRPGIQGTNPRQAGAFTVYQLDLESEIEAAGRYFNNALSSADGRSQYMKKGIIFYAEHATDESRSFMFYIDKTTREAKNFVGKRNSSVPPQDESQIKVLLRQQNLISN